MLLMDIITWEPKDSAKVESLYKNYEYPKGMKVIDEWIDLTGYRMFVIYETEDEKTYTPSVVPFIGICRFETVPVMKADKYIKKAQERAEKSGEKQIVADQGKEGLGVILEHLERLEKRIERLEHHSFIKQEDTT